MWWVRCHLDHAQITWWAAVRNRTNDFVERALDAVCIVRPAPRGKYYIIPGNISIDADLLDRMEKDYGPGFTTLNAAKTAYMLLHGPC